MLNIDYFRSIQNATGASSAQDIVVAETSRDFEDGFSSSVNLNRGVTIGNRLQDFIITTTEESDICKIIARPYESFRRGEVLDYEGDFWLVTEKFIENKIFSRGIIQKCNHLLVWQNTETLEIIKRWSIAKDPYTSGEFRERVIAVGSGKYKIKLPYDDETKLLRREKRFLMDISGGQPIAYRLVRFDGITNNSKSTAEGFLVINVEEDELQDDDNKELWVANYVAPKTDAAKVGNVLIEYVGDPELRVGGSAKSFKALFLDTNGNPALSLAPIWSLDFGTLLQHQIEVKHSDDCSISLRALNNEDIIGEKFILKVTANDTDLGDFEAQVELTLISYF